MISKLKTNLVNNSFFFTQNTENTQKTENIENSNSEIQTFEELDKFLENEANPTDEEAAKMLGFFVKTSRDNGFPWDIKAKINGKIQNINELQALELLKNNQGIILIPKRKKIIDLGAKGQELTALGNISNLENIKKIGEGIQKGKDIIKNTELKSEIKDGEPISIKNYKELKLLYALFSENNEIISSQKLNELTQTLKPFISEKYKSNYFWEFYDPKDNSLKTKLKSVLRNLLKGGVIGSGIFTAFASPLILVGSLLFGMNLPSIGLALLSLAGAGFISGSIWGTKKGLKESKVGKELGIIQVLKYLTQNKPFTIQQKTINQFNIPFLGNTTWKSNYKQHININNLENLKTLKNIYYPK